MTFVESDKSMKLPERPFPWRRLIIFALAGIVIGNSLVTVSTYVIGRPEITAWTGHVAQSSGSAVNDLLLGVINVCLALYLLRKS